MSVQDTVEKVTQTPPPIALMEMATGHFVSQAVYVAAKLGLADLLEGGARTAAELAAAVGANPSALHRLLRMLASRGIFVEDAQERFGQSPLSACLRAGAGSLRAPVILWNEEQYRAWGDVLETVKTGETAFNRMFGVGWFAYVERHPETAAIFNSAMTGWMAQLSAAVVQAYDFSRFGTIIDVGGGHGALLIAILNAFTGARGVVFDTDSVVPGAKQHVESEGLLSRCDVTGGDFFKSVPRGGDAYVLSQVLHDWDDEQCVAILKNCHDAMAEGGTLLVIETVITRDTNASFATLSDLHMLVVTGGRERTHAEYGDLFAQAGFRLTKLVPTSGSPASVIEGLRS